MKETHPRGLQILLERKLNRCSRSSDFVWVLKDLTHGCMRQASYCMKLASHCQSSRTSWYLFMQHLFISGGSLLLGGQAQPPKADLKPLHRDYGKSTRKLIYPSSVTLSHLFMLIFSCTRSHICIVGPCMIIL